MLCPASVNRRNRYLLSLKRTFDITHPLFCRERVQNKTKIGKKSCFSCYSVAMGTVIRPADRRDPAQLQTAHAQVMRARPHYASRTFSDTPH